MKRISAINESYEKFKPTLGFDLREIKQVSPEWFAARLGVITSTGAAKVCGSKVVRATYMKQIIAEIITGEAKGQISAKPLEHGIMNEPRARATYRMELEARFEAIGEPIENAIITELPFVFKDDTMRVGTSLDGVLLGLDATLEIKCPWNSEHHIEIVESAKIKKEYEFQTQHHAYVMDADCIHFGSFDPRFRKKKLVVKEIPRNEVFMNLFDDSYAEFNYNIDKTLKNFWSTEFGFQWDLKEYKKLQEEL